MNEYLQYFQSTLGKHARDKYFLQVLNYFDKKPIHIFELGCSRRLEMDESNCPAKKMDGWSTLFWANYVAQYGGKLTICDVSLEALSNCKTLIFDFLHIIDVRFILDDGKKYISDDIDLLFLDGSDSPTECLEQFERANRDKTAIFCDDAHVKSVLVRNKYRDFIEWDVNGLGHLMTFYPNKKILEKNILTVNNQNIIGKTEEFDDNIINDVIKTNKIITAEKGGEKIIICVPSGTNRNNGVLHYHKKVMSHFKLPTNYFTLPQGNGFSHGAVCDWIVQNCLNLFDYIIFIDDDLIPLRSNFIEYYYNILQNKDTIISGVSQSNHLKNKLGTDFNHPYCGLAGLGFSREVYLKLGKPSLNTDNIHSDNGEQLTYAAEEEGFNVCQIWPKSSVGLTDEQCDKLQMDRKYKKSQVGCFEFGYQTIYGNDLFFHCFCAGADNHDEVFINKCKEVIQKN